MSDPTRTGYAFEGSEGETYVVMPFGAYRTRGVLGWNHSPLVDANFAIRMARYLREPAGAAWILERPDLWALGCANTTTHASDRWRFRRSW